MSLMLVSIVMRDSPFADAKATTTHFSESFKSTALRTGMQILLLCKVTPLETMMVMVVMVMPAMMMDLISSAHF
jgi:hypothetical protein